VIVSGNVLGDLWDWVVGAFERIGDVSVYWLALALALKTAESRSLAAVEAVAPRAMAQGEAGSCHLQRLASLRERGGASVWRLVLLPHRRQRRLHGRLAAKTGIASLCESRTTLGRVNLVADFGPKL
jgi:hypothetical protein